MAIDFIDESVKTRLILSGISEIEAHGIKDFSLRRVALGAQVSCAAPYRHFKDKQDMIDQIIKYIGSQWNLIFMEIKKVYSSDLKSLIKNACITYLRFWIGNVNFRTILMSSPHASTLIGFDDDLEKLIAEYFGFAEFYKTKFFTVRSIVYGSILLSGFSSPDEIVASLSNSLDKEI